MKNWIYLLLLPMLTMACGSKNGSANKEMTTMATQDSVMTSGVQHMLTSDCETDIAWKGKTYHSRVVRTPDESLPHVSNEMGDTFADNKIAVRLTLGTETVFNKTFTKSDFASVVDADFLSKSILEGIVFDKTTPEGIVYAGSVCYPQTDLYVPLAITIAANGKMSIRKVDILDDEPAD